MTIKHRLEKLEQQAEHRCPTCQRPYDNPSPTAMRERVLQRLRDKGYSAEEAQEIYAEAEKRAAEWLR